MAGIGETHRNENARRHGWLTRLRGDVRGNTMAMMAIAIIPLAGMIGGGFDLSRMYIVKTRLQHACDAGALAGRRAMGGGTWSQASYAPRTAAERFFEANIADQAYGATSITKSYTESAGRVSGTATAELPMTLMRIFGADDATMTVTCDAEMRLPNTDVMFVLDVTGSMNCVAGDTSCTNNGEVPAAGSKIDGLKLAVKCFYETVARLDTDALCEGGAPSGGTGDQVQMRFGFVPYAINVNVGKLLPTSWIADNWTYQSREFEGMVWEENWSVDRYTYRNASGGCNAPAADTSTTQYRVEATSIQYYGNVCRYDQRQLLPNWRYGPISIDVSGLKNGTAWRDSLVVEAMNNNASDRTVQWNGCIEERQTVRTTDYDPIPADAEDLDILNAPVPGDTDTQWGPLLPELIFARRVTTNWSQIDRSEVTTTINYYNNIQAYCPTEARKLQSWPSADAFETYVDSLVARGNTYHDIGLVWGARFLAPTGMFRAENEFTPSGGEIERHLIFMSDGDSQSFNTDINAYGLPLLDRRQTDEASAPTNAQLIEQIDLRFAALCRTVRNQNITLWVISFGGSTNINPTTQARLEACASPGRFFSADNSAALQKTFRSIADQISALRLTK